jgi:uncharacterized repeat protein (TIGR01451 family)
MSRGIKISLKFEPRFWERWVLIPVMVGLLLAVGPGENFASSSPPNPGDSVLIIYVTGPCNGDASYNQIGATRLQAALNAISAPFTPTVTMLGVPCSTSTANGIYTALTGAGLTLGQFCEVWDVRFMANPPTPPCNTQQADVITSNGGNNDTLLFQNFLAQGGHLFLGGDNGGFCPRNSSVVNFVQSVTGCTLPYPNTFVGQENWIGFDNSGPDNFKTNLNNLANLYTWYPGRILLSQACNGKALVSDGTYALSLLWQSSALNTGNGKLAVDFDTNSYSDTVVADIPDNHYIQYYQNMYTALADCFSYKVTKTVNPMSACIGQPVTYTICLNNNGGKGIPNPQIVDTISTCLTYVSSNPPSTGLGNMRIFNFPTTLAGGQSQCVSIVAQPTLLPPCP